MQTFVSGPADANPLDFLEVPAGVPQELITCPGPLKWNWALSLGFTMLLGDSTFVRKPCVLWS